MCYVCSYLPGSLYVGMTVMFRGEANDFIKNLMLKFFDE